MTTSEFCKKYSVERKGTNSIKWDDLENVFGDANLTAMWVADMEFKAPDAVLEALTKRIAHGAFGYSYAPDDYYESVIRWQDTKHGYRLEREWIRLAHGAVVSLYKIVNAFTKPSDAVIIMPPVYYPFHNAVKDTGRKLITCDLLNDKGNYSVDFEDFKAKMEMHSPKVFILCSPHNPVGRVWSEQELETMLDICQKAGCLVLADELHQDLVMGDKKQIPAAAVKGGAYADNIITIFAASKTFNLAAFFHSHIVIENPKLRKIFDDYSAVHHEAGLNLFGAIATQAAYDGGEEWYQACLNVIWENYNYLKAQLEAKLSEAVISPLEGTYLAWVDLRAYIGTDPAAIKEFVQDKCRLAVDYGEWFGAGNEGFIRINLATDPKYIKLAVENILKNI